jgi:ABC-type nitrate/sulfonate/bicarbonate transport system substrate-binding protein
MKPFKFYLDWIINSQFAGLCWALDKGFYQKAGLDVTLIPWKEDGHSIIDKVTAGGMCAGSSEDNLIVASKAVGVEVRALAVMLQESPLVLMTKPKSGIRSLTDLPGKRVAMHVDGIRILEAVLALKGINQSDIEITEVAYDLNNLIQDRFDAVQGYVFSEPFALAAMEIKVHLIPIRDQRLHPYAQVFFATENCITQHSEILRSFLAASFAGWQQAMVHRQEAAHTVVKVSGGLVDLVTEQKTIETMYPYVAGKVGLNRFGTIDTTRWEDNLESYARFRIIPRQISTGEVVDDKFLREIYPEQPSSRASRHFPL